MTFLRDGMQAGTRLVHGSKAVPKQRLLHDAGNESHGALPGDEGGLLRRMCQSLAGAHHRTLVFAMEPAVDGSLTVRAAAGFGAPWFADHTLRWRSPRHGNPLERCVKDLISVNIRSDDIELLPESWDVAFAFLEAQSMLVCPVRGNDGEPPLLLGMIALFHADTRRGESYMLSLMAGLAENAIMHGCAHARLEHENGELRLVARALEYAFEGVIITDALQRILVVNHTVQRVTGYSEAELVGQTPKLLGSGLHTPEYYREMWETLRLTGQWKGEILNRRKNGEVYPELLSISAIHDDQGAVSHYVAIFIDISQQKEVERQLNHLAYHDPLTGLPNRVQFRRRLDEMLAGGGAHAVLLLDLDRFKNVNDSFGHIEGDAMLAGVAARFANILRDGDLVARLGGDEFSMLLCDVRTEEDALAVTQKVIAALDEPFVLPQLSLKASVSIGIARYPADGGDSSTLMRHADAAMYAVKRRGGNGFEFYRQGISSQARERLEMENDLRRAIEVGELRLFYQPLVELDSGRLVGVEALVRWYKDGKLVPPADFIPLAEETGLIIPIGDWVLREACSQCRSWRDNGLPDMRVAVNLSLRQLRSSDLVDNVAGALRAAGLQPDALELEITESVAADSADGGVAVMSALRMLGVQLAIDDFGTGFSCLSYLKRFPVGKLKIDRSFVLGMLDDPNDDAIVGAIIAMAGSMGMRVLAEGIESAEQLAHLRFLGCEDGQGFFFGKPAPAAELDLGHFATPHPAWHEQGGVAP